MKTTFSIFATFFAATVAFAAPTFVSNSIKYSDTSKPHATGRAGNATIDAQTLIDKQGIATVTVSSNGNLDKVQLQPSGDNAVNFNGLTGSSFSQTLSNLAPRQALRIQANVSGVAGRTGVVSADDVVKYRPDLAVGNVVAPQRTIPGAPFLVSATVHELNGDVGARANCVLSADGAEVARANGIWVDSGDSVTCTFSAVLTAMGSHTLTVSAANVDPADYDDANNSASSTIVVSNPFDSYHATALQLNLHTDRKVTGAGGVVLQQSTTDQKEQQYSFGGNYSKTMNLDSLWMHVRETTDGTFVSEKTSTGMTVTASGDADGGYSYTCRDGSDDYTSFRACNHTTPDGSTFFAFGVMRWSTAVNYVSGDVYQQSTTGQQSPAYGSNVSLDLTVSDGVTTLQAAPTIQMNPVFVDRGVRRSCRNNVCTEVHTTESGTRGVLDATGSY